MITLNRFLCIAFLVAQQCCFAVNPLLMVRLKVSPDAQDPQSILKQLEMPGTRDVYRVQRRLNREHTSGIFATYAGYLARSGWNGLLTFPLRHSTPEALVVVTNRIEPITLTSNTVDHWQLKPGAPAALYHITQEIDPDTDILSWVITPLERPANNKLPADALIIFAKPNNVIVPQTKIPVQKGPHRMLPPIQIKDAFNSDLNALQATNFFHLFKPVRFANKQDPTRHTKQIKGQ